MKRNLYCILKVLLDILFVAPIVLGSIVARFWVRKVDIGLGPEPLINNSYHKKALVGAGYVAETYVVSVCYITSKFDYFAPSMLGPFPNFVRWHLLFLRAIFRYQCLYFSFHGGPLMGTVLLRLMEPYLLKLARVKTVILPYGSDVQDMTRCPNLAFTAAVARDYPTQHLNRQRIARQIDRWSRHADHVVAGCDWVDYMHYWDSLALNNFSIDTDYWHAPPLPSDERPIRILHSPNHRAIKGTAFFEQAVRQLQKEGLAVELVVLERASNEEIKNAMAEADIVADQLIIGWYAMFAMEGMAMGKPVLCYIRPDLKSFYLQEGLLGEGEMPLVECSPQNVVDVLRAFISDRHRMNKIGEQSRQFAVKHHSLQAVGKVFDSINRRIGIIPKVNT